MTLGSLLSEDLERLEDMGLLEPDEPNEEEAQREKEAPRVEKQVTQFKPARAVARRGAPWFEELIENSRLGRIKRQKGGYTSEDGTTSAEWEIIEWTNEGEEEGRTTPSKRKHGTLETEEEDPMDTRT